MIYHFDEKKVKIIERLCDIALRAAGTKNLNPVLEILQTINEQRIDNGTTDTDNKTDTSADNS